MLTVAAGLGMALISLVWKTPKLIAITIFICLLVASLELLLYIPRSKAEGKKIGMRDWVMAVRTFARYRNG
jgi:hypothetical protein